MRLRGLNRRWTDVDGPEKSFLGFFGVLLLFRGFGKDVLRSLTSKRAGTQTSACLQHRIGAIGFDHIDALACHSTERGTGSVFRKRFFSAHWSSFMTLRDASSNLCPWYWSGCWADGVLWIDTLISSPGLHGIQGYIIWYFMGSEGGLATPRSPCNRAHYTWQQGQGAHWDSGQGMRSCWASSEVSDCRRDERVKDDLFQTRLWSFGMLSKCSRIPRGRPCQSSAITNKYDQNLALV